MALIIISFLSIIGNHLIYWEFSSIQKEKIANYIVIFSFYLFNYFLSSIFPFLLLHFCRFYLPTQLLLFLLLHLPLQTIQIYLSYNFHLFLCSFYHLILFQVLVQFFYLVREPIAIIT